MGFLNHARRKYLVLLPIVFLILNALFVRYQTREIQDAMLRQKLLEVTDAVDMLASIVESERVELCEDCEACERCGIERASILEGVRFIDELYYIYAAAYSEDAAGLTLVSARNNQTDFDPLLHGDFLNAVFSSDGGNVIISAEPSGEEPRDLHIYFRWIPVNGRERYLVVAGVSWYSVVTKIPQQVFVMQLATMGVTFTFDMVAVLLLVYLGHIYDRRDGTIKWRCRRP